MTRPHRPASPSPHCRPVAEAPEELTLFGPAPARTGLATPRRAPRRPVLDADSARRFRDKCAPLLDADGHLWWLGAIDGNSDQGAVQAGLRRGGYGRFSSGRAASPGGAVVVLAHRYAWMLAAGPVPPGIVVRHRCDEPLCMSAQHLELGTVGENNRDASERGRAAGRSRHWQLDTRGPAERSRAIRDAVRAALAAGHADARSIADAAAAARAEGEQWRARPTLFDKAIAGR